MSKLHTELSPQATVVRRVTEALLLRLELATLDLMKREAGPQSIDILPALETWYEGYPADEMCAAIRGRMQSIVDRAFGYHVLQIGPLPNIDLVDTCRINHRIHASTARAACRPGLHCHGDELPFASDSMDMVVAFHALEFDEHPHGTLREVQRVLRPHGQLVIIGFNPVSLLGATLQVRRWRSQPPWRDHRPVRVGRLTDWLHLLDCKLESVNYLYPIPLRGRGRVHAWVSAVDAWAAQRKLPGGGVYVAHAVKQIAGMRRPRTLPVRARERLVGLAVGPSPTPREPQLGSADAARITVSESANDS